MKYYNFFKNKEIFYLTLLFIVLSIIHIIYATIADRGLFIDGSLWFPKILNSLSAKSYGFYLVDDRTRWVTNFINQLPMNIAYNIGFSDKNFLLSMFSLPLFLFPFLTNIANIFLAKRTKRYDIVLCSLFLYSFCILPAIMYSVVEVYLGSSLLLLLFHYFVANIDYNWKDILLIVLLCLGSFGLTELAIFQGIFVFFLSFHLIQRCKNRKSKIVKAFIAICQLLAAIFVFLVNYFVLPGIQHETQMFFSETYNEERNMFLTFWKEPYLVEAVTFILFLIILFFFKKKKMKKNIMILIITLYILLFGVIVYFRGIFLYNYNFISYRVVIFLIFPLLIFSLFLQETLKKYFHKNILYNFFIIILICGITNTLIQFFYSYKTNDLQERFFYIVDKSHGKFIHPEEKLLKNIYLAKDNIFFVVLSPTSDYLSLCPEKKIDKIVLPFSRKTVMPIFRKFKIDPIKDKLFLHFIEVDLSNEFWDMTIIEQQYMKQYAIMKNFQIKEENKKSREILNYMNFDKNGNIIYLDENLFFSRCSKNVKKKLKKYINQK